MAEEALNIWREKLEFLLREEAIASDPSLKFELQQRIKEAQAKVAEFESASAAPLPPPGSGFDVFLSHNSADKPTIRKIAQSLQQRGLRVWLDEWELVPGRPWQDALEEIIRTTRSAAVFVGTQGIGPWEEPEMRACLSEFVDRQLPVIPVLLPNTPGKPRLPLFLRQFTWVDLRPGITKEGLDRLVWGITGSKAETTQPTVKPGPLGEQQTKELKVNRITEVFKTVGLPEYTYVEPDIYEDVVISIETPGKHLLLHGPSGSGKTCLIRRILSDLRLGEKRGYTWISGLEDDCQEKALELASSAIKGQQRGIVVIDDVHILAANVRSHLAKQLKQLSDKAYIIDSPATFILIGIPTTAESMLLNATDLGPRIEVRKMPPASSDQLLRLIHEGERRLAIRFSNPKSIIAEANASFCLCQNICLNACRVNGILETQEDARTVPFKKAKVRAYLVEQLSNRFLPLLISLCKQGQVKDGEKNPFLLIVKALAGIKKPVIRLPEILAHAGDDANAIKECKTRIREAMAAAEGGETFLKLFHYDEQVEVFSIEDPMFRYYLNYMDMSAVMDSLGIEHRKVTQHGIY